VLVLLTDGNDTGSKVPPEKAAELAGKEGLTIVTTSLAIVSKVQFAEKVEIVLLGGFLRGDSPDLHGPLTEQNVEQFLAVSSYHFQSFFQVSIRVLPNLI